MEQSLLNHGIRFIPWEEVHLLMLGQGKASSCIVSYGLCLPYLFILLTHYNHSIHKQINRYRVRRLIETADC